MVRGLSRQRTRKEDISCSSDVFLAQVDRILERGDLCIDWGDGTACGELYLGFIKSAGRLRESSSSEISEYHDNAKSPVAWLIRLYTYESCWD